MEQAHERRPAFSEHDAPLAQTVSAAVMHEGPVRLRVSVQCLVLCLEWSKTLTALRSHTCHTNQSLLLTLKESRCVLKNKDQETLISFFHSCYCPGLANYLCRRPHRSRSEKWQPTLLFPFSPSSLTNKLKVESVGHMCLYQSKSFVLHFHCSGKNKTHVHARAMKPKLCMLGDFTRKLNALMFALKTVIGQYKDEL